MALPLNEARDLISTSPFVDKLNELSITVSYPHLNREIKLKGLYNIYKYFYGQFVGWENLTKANLPYVNQSYSYYKNILTLLEQIIRNNMLTSERDFDNLYKRNIVNVVKSSVQHKPFPFDVPEVDFLEDLNSKDPNLSNSAFNYFMGNGISINTTAGLEGAIMAYEFRNQDKSAIFNRRVGISE